MKNRIIDLMAAGFFIGASITSFLSGDFYMAMLATILARLHMMEINK